MNADQQHDAADETTDDGGDARNRPPEDYEAMPGSFVDTPHNMPGDQPEDTPPSKTKADGTADPSE